MPFPSLVYSLACPDGSVGLVSADLCHPFIATVALVAAEDLGHPVIGIVLDWPWRECGLQPLSITEPMPPVVLDLVSKVLFSSFNYLLVKFQLLKDGRFRFSNSDHPKACKATCEGSSPDMEGVRL